MPLRVEGPTRTEMKPKPWRVNPRYVAPEWRWAWEYDPVVVAPFWNRGGPFMNLVDGSLLTVGSGLTWGTDQRGLSLDADGTQTDDVLVADTAAEGIDEGDSFTVVVVGNSLDVSGSAAVQWMGTRAEGGGPTGWAFSAEVFNDTGKMGFSKSGVADITSTFDSPTDGPFAAGVVLHPDQRPTFFLDGQIDDSATDTSDPGGSDNSLQLGESGSDGGQYIGGYEAIYIWPEPLPFGFVRRLTGRDPFGPFRRQTIRYTGGPTAAGQTFTVSLAEAVVARDTLEDTATLTVEVADVASAQSTETETLTMRETVSEVGVAADQLTDAQVMVEVLSEATRANDQMVGTLGRVFAAVLTESVSATDTVQSRMTAVETIAETVRAADQLNITATLRETLAESTVAADTVTAPVAGVITATLKESVSAGESLETTMTMTAQVREAVRALDRLGLTQTLVTQVIEQAVASDQLESTLPAEALRFIFDAVRGNQDFDAVDGGTFDAQGRNDFDASGAD